MIERQKLWEQAKVLRDLFARMDLDDSGYISYDEFCECMNDPKMVAYMFSVNVNIYDAKQFFKMLESDSCDSNGKVDIERFVRGCMAMKGSATAVDMQKQLYLIEELSRTLRSWEKTHWPKLLHAKSACKHRL